MFCTKCGVKIEEGTRFCTGCGTPIAAQQQTAMPSPAPQYIPAQPQQYRQTAETNMNPWQYFVSAVKKYTVFSGRVRRAEFWWFVLFSQIISIVASLIGGVLGLAPVVYIYSILDILVFLFFFLPGLAIWIRRMHDVGKSGWYIFIPIYDIVLAATAGNTGANQYGPDPKGA